MVRHRGRSWLGTFSAVAKVAAKLWCRHRRYHQLLLQVRQQPDKGAWHSGQQGKNQDSEAGGSVVLGEYPQVTEENR